MTPASDAADEEIAAHVQQGNIDSFGILIERYEPKMMRYARRFLQDSDEMKDIVQDVFIKAYVNIRSFDTARRFSPWIYRIAHNELVNTLKKKSLRETISIFDFDVLFPHISAKETTDSELQKEELQKAIDSSLSKLSPKYREPLILYYFEDMGYKQIAEVLQLPVSTVGVRLQRGKALLKELVKDLK